ncbi:MAG: twin transmembrane helix small protein [Gammaproteobacteria bacterium]|nr:twin transmembrane helix small protein [Gammaproteobacteria bacterium]
MLFKTIVIFILFLVVSSLFTALYSMIKDKGQSNRTVKMLTMRIGMSIGLLILLLIGYQLGWINPHPV